MSKINQIQSSILALGPGAYQKLMDDYLVQKFKFDNITPLGSQEGTDKTTKGTPDSYVRCKDGRFILIAHGTVGKNTFAKIEKDIFACLDEAKTGIPIDDIAQIICCHTSTNITPGEVKQLCSHFPNTLLVDLGTTSHDLLRKYPNLARDHLFIEIDTHQIFDVKDFVDHTSKNTYSTTLDMPLICREKELSELFDLLERNPIVLIFGKSGIGKTRLALEVADQYASKHKYTLKIIKSNNEPIYEDIKATFTDDQDFLVLVDDADQLVHLGHLLDMSKDGNRINDIKILMTVRDYAKEKLIRTVRAVYFPTVYELEFLSDDHIAQVLSENLNIQNDELLKHIKLIAKGNVRLAIMAGNCAVNGKLGQLRNAFDIFDDYFSGIIEDMDKDELMTAGLVAFFDAFSLQDTELPFVIAAEQGIGRKQFIDICHILHVKEVVSIFEDLAIKFENQNLRDYLLYYIFYKEKWLTPSYMIKCAFPEYRQKIVFAFNTLGQLFYTEENVKYLEMEIRKAWPGIKKLSDDTTSQFIEAFQLIIPDESLLFVKRKIEELPEYHTDFTTFDFHRTSNNHRIDSKLIQLLIRFKYTNRFLDAIHLAIRYLEHSTENPMDFFFMFSEEWGPGKDSIKYGYSQESLLLQFLMDYYMEKMTPEASKCLSFYSSHLLKLDFSYTESNRNESVTFYQFGYAPCDNVYTLRELCFKALAVLYDDNKYRCIAINILMNYSGHINLESDIEIVKHDLIALESVFNKRLDPDDFECCLILRHFHNIFKRNDIEVSNWLLSYRTNRIFSLYVCISKDAISYDEGYEEGELAKKEKIQELCKSVEDEDLEALWTALTMYKANSHDVWSISEGISFFFSALSALPERFISAVGTYIYSGTPFDSRLRIITSNLISILGYNQALAFVNGFDFDHKLFWLAEIYDNIPESEIDGETPDFFIAKLVEQKDKHLILSLSLLTVIMIERYSPGFLIRYVETMNNICENSPNTVSNFLSQLDLREGCVIAEFVGHFNGNIDVLEKAYNLAKKGRTFFDDHGQLLIKIIGRDQNFLTSYIKDGLSDRCIRDEWRELVFLWEQDNYRELVSIVVDTIIDAQDSSYLFAPSIEEWLFALPNDKTELDEKQSEWLRNYINKNCNNENAIYFIFNIICNFTDERKLPLILHFCKCNPSFSAFQHIHIFPNHSSWSGSEVPILESKIDFLDSIRNKLIGVDYIEHRAYLIEYIQHIQEYKDHVLMQEFIDAR